MVLRGLDAWRRHPIFKWKIPDALPGLREGAAAFAVYCAAEWASEALAGDEHAHEHAHGAAAAVHKDAKAHH